MSGAQDKGMRIRCFQRLRWQAWWGRTLQNNWTMGWDFKVTCQWPLCTIWVFPKRMVPQNGWFISWKTLLKWMIWGYPYFWKHLYIQYMNIGIDSAQHQSTQDWTGSLHCFQRCSFGFLQKSGLGRREVAAAVVSSSKSVMLRDLYSITVSLNMYTYIYIFIYIL